MIACRTGEACGFTLTRSGASRTANHSAVILDTIDALEVEIGGTVISRTNTRGLYWTFPQQLAHATVNGTNVRPGDLYASGTISGAEPASQGSLIELTEGRGPFLQDGDTVTLRGRAGDRVSFGEVTGTIFPA